LKFFGLPHDAQSPVYAELSGPSHMQLSLRIRSLGTARTRLLENLQIDVPPGCIHTVMGESGSGKSSLLAAVCGTLDAGMRFAGDITLGDRDIGHLPTEQRRVGILFQDDLLFAHMSVGENLLFAVPAAPQATRQARVMQALHDIELPHLADANPATLSGGQRSRVALMRAMLAEPQALLLDEPYAKLDTELRVRMRQLVHHLVQLRQIPVLLVTHDAKDIADPVRLTHLGSAASSEPATLHAFATKGA
jgi:putative thiamine transport system ATP-binding protein